MATVQRFEELEIWQLARKIYQRISLIADRLKKNHEYRFAEQMKCAAGSVMDNIAEGFERNSRLEFVNSLSIAKGECGELKSQLYRCLNDKRITEKEFEDVYADIEILGKKISSFIIYLNGSRIRGLKFRNRQ
jgi:four helix bundle protein